MTSNQKAIGTFVAILIAAITICTFLSLYSGSGLDFLRLKKDSSSTSASDSTTSTPLSSQSSTKPSEATSQSTTKELTENSPSEEFQSKPVSTDKLIAFTYDDGPYSKTTNRILDAFEKTGSKCTFFVVGNRVDLYPDAVKRALALGCEIGNHSFSHKNLTNISKKDMLDEISKTNSKLADNYSYPPSLLRVPGGNYNDDVKRDCDMPIILWSIDTVDWKYKNTSGQNRTDRKNSIINSILDNARDGDIILMHDIYEFSADISEEVVPKLVEKGFKLVTVSEMFEAKGIELSPGQVYRNAYPQSN